MVEPYYKFYNGDYETGPNTGHFSGAVYGAHVGYLGDNFMAGLTFENGEYNAGSTISETGSNRFKGGGIGTFLGFHFLDRWKIWTGYLNSALEPTNNRDKRYFGQHASVGIGYRLWEGLMFNFESFQNVYTQVEDDITGITDGLDQKIKTQGVSYSLSYILVF